MILSGTKPGFSAWIFFTLSSSRNRFQEQEWPNLNPRLFSEGGVQKSNFPRNGIFHVFTSKENAIDHLNFYSEHGRSIWKEKFGQFGSFPNSKQKADRMTDPSHKSPVPNHASIQVGI